MKWEKGLSRREFIVMSAAGAGALSLGSSQAPTLGPERAGNVWQEARALVDAGAIGRPYYVGLRLPRGVAPVDEIAGHVERVAYVLSLDTPDRVSAAGAEVEGDDFPADFMVTAKYEEGVTLSIATGEDARGGAPYVIRGDVGTLKIYNSPEARLKLLTDPRSDSGGSVLDCSDEEDAPDCGQLPAPRLTVESALDSLRRGAARTV